MKLTQNQIIHRARKLAAALRANKKKATGAMSNRAGGRCCLCVSEDVAVAAGKARKQKGRYRISFPQEDTIRYFGWDGENPMLFVNQAKSQCWEASEINDSRIGVPHRIIAEFFLLTFTPKYKLSKEAAEIGKKLIG